MNIAEYLGIDMDILTIACIVMAVLLLIFIIVTFVNISQMKKLKKRYGIFMEGKDAKTLEDTLIKRLDQVDKLLDANRENQENIKKLFANNQFVFQKVGLVKYDAFNEMGGKLSFSLAMLNDKNDGFIINAMHSREGCYTYIKEIIAGNSVIVLADEEKEALDMALNSKNKTIEMEK